MKGQILFSKESSLPDWGRKSRCRVAALFRALFPSPCADKKGPRRGGDAGQVLSQGGMISRESTAPSIAPVDSAGKKKPARLPGASDRRGPVLHATGRVGAWADAAAVRTDVPQSSRAFGT